MYSTKKEPVSRARGMTHSQLFPSPLWLSVLILYFFILLKKLYSPPFWEIIFVFFLSLVFLLSYLCSFFILASFIYHPLSTPSSPLCALIFFLPFSVILNLPALSSCSLSLFPSLLPYVLGIFPPSFLFLNSFPSEFFYPPCLYLRGPLSTSYYLYIHITFYTLLPLVFPFL